MNSALLLACTELKPWLHMRISMTRLHLLHTDAISRSIAWIGKQILTYYLKTVLFPIYAIYGILSQSYATKHPFGVDRDRFST